jgi:lysophospholipase L1-like esterase
VIYVSVSPRAGPIADQIDESLAGLAQDHTNVHVLDWGHLSSGNPAWLEPDNIHPTPAGQAELAALESQALHQYC